jgi:hypothetical protein
MRKFPLKTKVYLNNLVVSMEKISSEPMAHIQASQIFNCGVKAPLLSLQSKSKSTLDQKYKLGHMSLVCKCNSNVYRVIEGIDAGGMSEEEQCHDSLFATS